ncbi:hypothetical protein [Citricoccus muralis]|uniref:Uncharacterized protein n=1 Tax=Citricoccus muralis TaxID=169134 RepID=A0ABY8H3Z8_9MICC|nr:hypothetical protein [Citricoccus muralis]WFP15861.1 hypothetical protein P8192_10705 [Citricoccus muralis]
MSEQITVPRAGNTPPRERLELLETSQPATELWWEYRRDFTGQGWHELESVGQIADLVLGLNEATDGLTLEDEEPVTRYAQMYYLGEQRFQLELATVVPGGAYNFRIGQGAHAAEREGNTPTTSATTVQLLNRAQLIEVLTSWAQGYGLPQGYGSALHCYGDVSV